MTQTAVITLDNGQRSTSSSSPPTRPRRWRTSSRSPRRVSTTASSSTAWSPTSWCREAAPKGNGTGGPGHTVKAEFNKQKHLRGSLAMARSQDPDSAGSQFYITYGPTPHLDNNYTVFGRVTSGMEHVDRIKQGDRMKTVVVTEA